ncbi:hypothetical protein EE612_005938 [Oryza sativa]|nr:hypothetical protein EE612_005938 [Oryza sativa]
MGQQVQHESRINVGEATHVSKAEMGANTMFATSHLNSNNKVGPELAYSSGVASSASDSSTTAPSPCYLCHKACRVACVWASRPLCVWVGKEGGLPESRGP